MALTTSAGPAHKHNADLHHLGRGSTLKFAGAAVTTVMTFALIIIVTRGYGQEKAGVFFATTTLFLLIGQSAEIGSDQSLLRYIPALRATGRGGDVRALLWRVMRHVLISTGIVCVVTLAFAPFIGRALSESSDYQAVTTLIRVVVPFIPLIAITEVALAATRGYQSMRPQVVVYDITLPFLQAGMALAAHAAFGHGNTLALVLAFVVPYVITIIWAIHALRRLVAKDADLAPSEDPVVHDYWRFTVPRAAARICQYALRRIDVVLVAVLAGPREAAVYTVVSRFITVGSVGVQAVQQVAQPKLGELLELQDRPRAQEIFRTSTIWLVVASWPVFVIFGVYATVVLHAMGHGYTHGATALIVLCAAQLIVVATGPVDIGLVMTGRSGLSLTNQVAALFIDVVLCFALVPTYGVAGAAVAKAISLLVNNLVASVQVYMQQRLHPIGRGLAVAAIGCLVSIGGFTLGARLLFGQSLIGLSAGLILGAAGYVAICAHERESLRLDTLVTSLRGRRGPGGKHSGSQLSEPVAAEA